MVKSLENKQKGMMFSVSVRCPKCGKAIKMRVSDNPDYAYQCLECDEDFYAFECPDTVSGYYRNENKEFVSLYELTLLGKTSRWYTEHRKALNRICDEYTVDFMGCDDFEPENALIDFGWENAPDAGQIQGFTDKVLDLA